MRLEKGATRRKKGRKPSSASVSARSHPSRQQALRAHNGDLIADNSKFRTANETASSTGRVEMARSQRARVSPVVVIALSIVLFPFLPSCTREYVSPRAIWRCDVIESSVFSTRYERAPFVVNYDNRAAVSRLRCPLVRQEITVARC